MFTERNQTYRLVKTLMTGHDPISISSLNVENLIAKLNEPDFVNYIKSVSYTHLTLPTMAVV